MKKKSLILKFILTGIIYSIITCLIQVPFANILFSILKIESNTSLSNEMLPLLLLSIFIVGFSMAYFYYKKGHLFFSQNKLKQSIKFALFIYLSNYIPQVFFLDANNGLQSLVDGGFPVIQVELFDFLILIFTVLLMGLFMPCKSKEENLKNKVKYWQCILCGIVFSMVMVILEEIFLPLFGIQSMAEGLNVSTSNMSFFYGVMIIGFILAGYLVSYNALKIRNQNDYVCLYYGIFIWCAFDFTMLPLGFGIMPTISFIIVSIIAFILIDRLCKYFIRLNR